MFLATDGVRYSALLPVRCKIIGFVRDYTTLLVLTICLTFSWSLESDSYKLSYSVSTIVSKVPSGFKGFCALTIALWCLCLIRGRKFGCKLRVLNEKAEGFDVIELAFCLYIWFIPCFSKCNFEFIFLRDFSLSTCITLLEFSRKV